MTFETKTYTMCVEESEHVGEKATSIGSRFVFRESSSARIAWLHIEVFLVVYAATAWFYRHTFITLHLGPDGLEPPDEVGRGWAAMDMIVEVLFWMDLCVNFFMSYRDQRGNEVDSLRSIACHYMRLKFWIYLLPCIPASFWEQLLTGDDTVYPTAVIKVLRLVRIPVVANAAKPLARVLLSDSSRLAWFQSLRGVRLVNMIFSLMWAVHILACFWYLLAALHSDPETTWVFRDKIQDLPPFHQYMRAMSWAFCMLFLCIGVADIGTNIVEIVFCTFAILVGAAVNGIIISTVIDILSTTDAMQQVIDKQLHLIETFSEHAQLDWKTTKSMKSHVSWSVNNRGPHASFDKAEMKELLTANHMPHSLLSRMQESMFDGRLLRNEFLRGVTPVPLHMVPLLAAYVQRADFRAGEIIYGTSDFPSGLYLVLSGTFAFIGRPSSRGGMNLTVDEAQDLYPYLLCSHKGYFGQVELTCGPQRVATVRCEKDGTALVLSRQDFLELREMFPMHAGVWGRTAVRHERLRKESLKRLTRGLALEDFAATNIQQYVRRRRDLANSSEDDTQPTGSPLGSAWMARSRAARTRASEDQSSRAEPPAAPSPSLAEQLAAMQKMAAELSELHAEVTARLAQAGGLAGPLRGLLG